MASKRNRRLIASLVVSLVALASATYGVIQERSSQLQPPTPGAGTSRGVQGPVASSPALDVLQALPIKGRAAKTGYSREQFGDGWRDIGNCDMRNYILARDMENKVLRSVQDCTVLSGTLHDPYTGKTIAFVRAESSSALVQVDHVVALSDAWQKGAQHLSPPERDDLANDPLNLLAVDGPTNNKKSDSDAASWLPPNKPYRCAYVARQLAVKQKYRLWVTQAEHDTMRIVLSHCPDQVLPVVTPAPGV